MSEAIAGSLNPEFEDLIDLCSLMPLDGWLSSCRTDFQRQHWYEMKALYSALSLELKSQLEQSPSPLKPLRTAENETLIYFLETWAKTYVKLCDVVRNAWEYLVSSSQELEIPLPPHPVDTLLVLFMNDCQGIFEQYQHFHECRPRRLHNLYRQVNNINNLRKKSNLTQKEVKEVQKFETEVKRFYHRHQEFVNLRLFCIEAADYFSEKDRTLKSSLMDYKKVAGELDRLIASQFHPSKGLRGFNVKDGILYPLT